MKTGVFLTPGAARTAYQVGALHALVHEGEMHFDVIASCSVGAVNGAYAAMGETDRLVELWSQWTNSDVMELDPLNLLKHGVFWAPSLASNEPQHENAIDPYVDERKLQPNVRFRINLANLTTGENTIVEYPGDPMPMRKAVKASIAVPVAFRPVAFEGHQYVDGLAIDGCALEQLLLEADVQRAFVLGVSPRTEIRFAPHSAYQTALRAFKWNQYSEPLRAIAHAEQVNKSIRDWQTHQTDLRDVIAEAVPDDEDLRSDLEEAAEEAYAGAGFPYEEKLIEIIPILPKHEIEMDGGEFDHDPDRTRALIDQGRRDALAVLEEQTAETFFS